MENQIKKDEQSNIASFRLETGKEVYTPKPYHTFEVGSVAIEIKVPVEATETEVKQSMIKYSQMLQSFFEHVREKRKESFLKQITE